MLLADIASTGFSGAESGKVRIGDTVVVFAQGPIGLCATAGAKLMGAAWSSASTATRTARRWRGAWAPTSCSTPTPVDVVAEVKRLTGGSAPTSPSRRSACRRRSRTRSARVRPGGTLSSLGVYSGKLQVPYDAFAAGLGDHTHRHDAVPRRQGAHGAADANGRDRSLRPDAAHHPSVRRSRTSARRTSSSRNRRDGVLKVAIRPWTCPALFRPEASTKAAPAGYPPALLGRAD